MVGFLGWCWTVVTRVVDRGGAESTASDEMPQIRCPMGFGVRAYTGGRRARVESSRRPVLLVRRPNSSRGSHDDVELAGRLVARGVRGRAGDERRAAGEDAARRRHALDGR